MKKRRFKTRRMLSRFVKKKNVEHIYICNCINFLAFIMGNNQVIFGMEKNDK